MIGNSRIRLFGALAAVSLAAGLATAAATPALAAATCPVVDVSGNVTPPPSPGVDWSGCDLASAFMPSANLAGAQLQNATLTNADLPNADLAEANLTGANLTNATAAGDNLTHASLDSANLFGTFVDSADLESADLTSASAIGAQFTGSDLKNATVRNVDLSFADLTSADFFGASMANLTTNDGTFWTHAICPNGASADFYTAGCLSAVSVTKPAATPTVTAGTLGTNGWYTSAVTVSWFWVDSNALNPAHCPGSTTSAVQGSGVVISASCTDVSSNTSDASVPANIDTTPPTVALTRVRNGASYPLGQAPLAQCTTADAVSGVARNAGTTIMGGRPDGTGVFTVTCTGAADNAGNNQASTLTAHYTVLYEFGGFSAPKPGSTLKASTRTITVRFRLSNQAGHPIPAKTAAALAAHHAVRATLRGPGISPATAACSWVASTKFLTCAIATPRHVLKGHKHRYTITATENLGTGFTKAPITAASENPEPIHFR
jgi:uncharacterized protein YjbI with pentapeptide repeats